MWLLSFFSAFALATVSGCAGIREPGSALRFVVEDRALHRIDARLFGHFLERPSWGGETGIEAAVLPETRALDPRVKSLLRDLRIPVLRFPGGTDVDYMDWRDMVDGVPGRGGGRPVSRGHGGDAVSNAFGYAEFLSLCEELGAEPLLVVNLGDALLGRKPLDQAALAAASLVAYANAPVGGKLPAGMQDWPAVRAKNGRERPYAARYVQIGNEVEFLLADAGRPWTPDADRIYVETLAAYVAAIRAVDADIAIVADAVNDRVAALIRERLGDELRFLSQHHYMPWRMNEVRREGRVLPLSELSRRELWYAWVAIPATFNELGESVVDGAAMRAGRRWGYKVAVTEWNWNGYWTLAGDPAPFDSSFAKSIGAAGYLHAFMRAGDVTGLACQSMTVGQAWGITAIRVDPSGSEPPYFLPTGLLLAFYARHHGDEMLAMSRSGVPGYAQPLALGTIPPQPRVALVDALATRSRRSIYVHAINRHFSDVIHATLDLRAFRGRLGRAVLHAFEGRLQDPPQPGESRAAAWTRDRDLEVEDDLVQVALPPRSVSAVEIELLR